jgi:fumarate hydratase subunit beta
VGGEGALLASCVRSCEVVAYPDLGSEAIYKLEVENFPVVVTIDSNGRDLYKLGREDYLKTLKADK